jgi:hypothetical protein
MGRTKTQRETRDFSMALVIKPIKITTKNTNFFREGSRPINLFWGGGGGRPILFFVFYSLISFLRKWERGGGGTMALAGPPLPPSLHARSLNKERDLNK